MGYCYTADGRLACDYCSGTPARKYSCPFGWCPPIAACRKCRKLHADQFRQPFHRSHGCERQAAESKTRDDRERELMAAGLPVRCAALAIDGHPKELEVHVLFRKADGSTVGHYMSTATYRALPTLDPFTIEDYRQHGPTIEAPATFDYGRTTKQVDAAAFAELATQQCKTHGFPAAECPWCTPDQHAQADQAAGDTTDMGEARP